MRKVILLLIFVACSALNALAQSFALSGSEHGIVNGVYTFVGVNKLNQPLYMHKSGQYEIFYDNNGTWWLGTDKNLSGGTRYYKASGTAAEIPLTGWVNDRGQSAPVLLVANPRNAEIIAARNATPVVINALGDSNPNLNRAASVPQHVTATQQTIVPADPTQSIGNTAQRGATATYYMHNLRFSKYRIYRDNCGDFDGLFNNNAVNDPDPRFHITATGGYDKVLKGDGVSCDWQRLNGAAMYFAPGASVNSTIPISDTNPFQTSLTIDAWEEDGCESDNEYNSNCIDGDDFPLSITHLLTLNLSSMSFGYNEQMISWSGGGTSYYIYVSWELSTTDRLVTVYADANFGGTSQYFGVGTYNIASISTGVGNDAISSMTIAPGYKVTAYNQGDFKGYPLALRGNVNIDGYNDKISSIKVETDDNLPPTQGKTLLIYFNGSGKSIDFQLERNASKIKADEMIFVKGVGGAFGPSPGFTGLGVFSSAVLNDGTYLGYNANNFVYEEGELLREFNNAIPITPFISTYYTHTNVFKNTNANAAPNSYLFGIDENYAGNAVQGYGGPDSYAIAANVLKVLKRYNLRGYDTILISGHSRGSAVGISSLLYGIKKALTNDSSVDGLVLSTGIADRFPDYADVINDVFGNANVINVLALDPVAGENTIGLRNKFHMGDDWHMNDMYAWFKGQYPSSNFSEIYANGAKLAEHDDPLESIAPSFWEKLFKPSPNYLYDSPSNNVQRYWLGYRHSSMENKFEKLSNCYDIMGVDRPWLHTSEMMNAALHNQTQFRDHTYWFNKFRKSDTDGWQGALKIAGCTDPRLYFRDSIAGTYYPPTYAPDADLEITYMHGLRHTNFNNTTSLFDADGVLVDMRTFVPDNNINFKCTGDSRVPSMSPASYTSSIKETDVQGWTHYCACTGELLLSLNAATTPEANAVQLVVGNNGSTFYPANTGFITNINGAAVMNHQWSVYGTASNTVLVRDYFDKRYYPTINQALNLSSQGVTDTTNLWVYKAVNPLPDIAGIPNADIYTNGTTASATNWKLGRTEKAFYAEYVANWSQIDHNRGGMGGSKLNDGPICAMPLTTSSVTSNGYYCSGSSGVSIYAADVSVGYNYQLFRDGSPVGSPLPGVNPPYGLTFGPYAVTGTYSVVASSLVGNCTASMTRTTVVTERPTPTVFNLSRVGTDIVLSGSEVGIYYRLVDGTSYGSYKTGTGAPLTFSEEDLVGTYTVIAESSNGCSATMTGSVNITGCPASTGSTIYVNVAAASGGNGTSWASAYTNLGFALRVANVCSAVTTVKVAAGTYKPNKKPSNNGLEIYSADDRDKTFYLRDGLILEGGYDAATGTRTLPTTGAGGGSILSGDIGTVGDTTDNAYHVVLALAPSGGLGVTISGFTITGGNATSNTGGSLTVGNISVYRNAGGGIYAERGTNTLINNTISGNKTAEDGGGIYTIYSTNILTNNVISGNKASQFRTGGMYMKYGSHTLTNNTVSDNMGQGINISSSITNVVNNNTISSNSGGGVSISGSNTTFSNNIVSGNNNLGGLSADGGTNTFTNNTFSGNTYFNGSGGGVVFSGYSGTQTFTNNKILNNTAEYGGGIYIGSTGVNYILTNNIVANNVASNRGGGVHTKEAVSYINNTFYGNSAAYGGGGIYTDGYQKIQTLTNNIFWANKKGGNATIQGADFYSQGTDTYGVFKNNILQLAETNYAVSNTGNYAIGAAASGNLFAQDPYFVDAAASNFQIGACSPATDAGTNTGAPALDLLGNAIFNTTKDVGAYERQTELCPVYTNAGNGCQTLTLNNVTGSQWFYFNNNKGRVAAINPNGQNLGTVTVEVNDANNPLTVGAFKFLGRNVNINSTTAPTANYTLRLYYYDTELTEYNTATNGTFALTDFNMAWASGGTNGTGCDLSAYRASATTNGLVAKADVTEAEYGANNNGFSLEMTLNHFTAFAATTTGGNPLPVKLLSFTAYKDKSAHRLNWTTATEQNVSHFEIEASSDPAMAFKTIGNVRAAGNSNTPKYYDFTNQPINQSTNQPIYYYRLKMIDFDGSFEYSNSISIKEDGKQVAITAFPNPSETGIFTLQGKSFERTDAIVTNVLGQAIPTTIQNNQLNLSTLPAGVYFVRIAGENNTISVVKL
jgi:parallel beta-helix repeat protein